MTTRFNIATIAAVSSAVLFFGASSNPAAALFLGDVQVQKPAISKPSTDSIPKPPKKVAPSVAPQTPPPAPAPVVEPPAPEPVAPEPVVPAVISHPVTDPTNSYVWGQCTWYSKERRPDLPNNLGNANTWYSIAAAQGLPVGTEPKAGAIGVSTAGEYGHVVYVESVNGDGTVNISEMNYAGGVGVVHYRTTPVSEFVYIY